MGKSKKLITKFIGKEGYETLHKAIYKDGSRSVLDPNEFMLPLLVVPRTILSWLVQNIRPLKIGEHKEMAIPHVEGATLWVQKQDADVYRGELTKQGKVIQTFDKQSLPTLGATLMSAGENYDHLVEKEAAPAVAEEPKKDSETKDIAREIIALDPPKEASDPEAVKWMTSRDNIKEMVGVIGKLVDALVAKKIEKESIDKKEISEGKDQHDLEESKDPSDIQKENVKANKDLPAVENKEGKASPYQTKAETKKLDEDQGPPECEKIAAPGSGGEIKKEEMSKTTDPVTGKRHESSSEGRSLRGIMARLGNTEKAKRLAQQAAKEAKKAAKPRLPEDRPSKDDMMSKEEMADVEKEFFPEKHKTPEPLEKPYVSDAQRRWAHTEAGKKALGGEKAVEHWDKASKGKDLPEKVSKEEMGKAGEMPSGRGMAKMPVGPKMPKPPVPAGHQPAGSAAKQSQAAQRGQQAAPKTPGAQQMKAPGAATAAPKAPTMTKAPAMPKPRGLRAAAPKAPAMKSDQEVVTLSKEEVFTPCSHCGRPEFKMGSSGQPEFSPCACFRVMRKTESGEPFEFVRIAKNENGSFDLQFNKKADPEAKKAFLLTVKAKLIIGKKYGIY